MSGGFDDRLVDQVLPYIEAKSPSHSSDESSQLPSRCTPVFCSMRARQFFIQTAEGVTETGPLSTFGRRHAESFNPNVRGPMEDVPESPAPRPMSAKEKGSLEAKMKSAISTIARPVKTDDGAATRVATARHDDASALEAIAAMFGNSGSQMLAERLLTDMKAVMGAGEKARDAALAIARGLRASTSEPATAGAVWLRLKGGTPPREGSQAQRDLNASLRALSRSDVAFETLWEFKRRSGHADAHAAAFESTKMAWQCADRLEQYQDKLATGPTAGTAGTGGLDAYIAFARQELPRMVDAAGQPFKLGDGAEPEHLLACQAILAAQAKLNNHRDGGARALDAQQCAASFAWRNGYRESGKGTQLHECIHMLGWYPEWMQRAVDRPELFSRRAGEAIVNGLKSLAGIGLSPMSAVKKGTIGANLGLAPVATAWAEHAIREARYEVRSELYDRLQFEKMLEAHGSRDIMVDCVVKDAILQYWQDMVGPDGKSWGGRKNFKLDDAARQQILNLITATDADGNSINGVTAAEVRRNKVLFGKVKLNLATLKSWGTRAARSDERRAEIADAVATARARVNAKPQAKPAAAAAAPAAAIPTMDDLSGPDWNAQKELLKTLPADGSAIQDGDVDLDKLQAVTQDAMHNTVGMRYSKQGYLGADIAAGLGFATPTGGLSVTAGPQVRGGVAQAKFVRVGTTSAGTEITLGRETIVGGSAAALGRLGYSFKSGVLNVNSGLNVSGMPLGLEGSREVALSMRFPRGTRDQKLLGSKLNNFFFDEARAAQAEGRATLAGPQLFEKFAQTFEAHPELTFDYQTNNGFTTRHNVSGSLSVIRVGSNGWSFGPTVAVAADHSRSNAHRKDHKGLMTTDMANKGSRTTVQVQGGLGGAIPKIDVHHGGIVNAVRLPNRSMGNVRCAFNLDGNQGQVRLAVVQGKVDPKLTLKYYEDRTESAHLRRIESMRDFLENVGADVKQPDGSTQYQTIGKQALDDYIRSVKELNFDGMAGGGNRGFLTRLELTPQAAEDLTHLLDQQQQLISMGAQPGDPALDQAARDINRVYHDDASWKFNRLGVFEVESEAHDVGLDLFVSVRQRTQASSTLRYLAEIRPPGETATGGGAALPPPPRTLTRSALRSNTRRPAPVAVVPLPVAPLPSVAPTDWSKWSEEMV